MKSKIWSLLMISQILLASCSFKGETEAYRNGELLYLNEIHYENAFVDANFEMIDNLIKAQETFTFYITNKDCASCQDFKDKITTYIKDTKQLIYRFDISSSQEDLVKLGKAYQDFFFPGGSIVTPQVYVFSIKKASQFVKNTRYETTTMFTNAMKEYVYETNVYNISSFKTFELFIENNNELPFYIYNRVEEDNAKIFSSEVKELINKTKKNFALIDINRFSENDISSLERLINKENIVNMSIAGYYSNKQLISTKTNEKAGDINSYLADLL